MCPDRIIRRFAGALVLLSLILGYFVQPAFHLIAAVVGFNLLQSSFSDFCPLERLLGAARLFGCGRRAGAPM